MVEPPPLAGALHDGWLAILELAARLPQDWVLVGGQMVMLHCWERDAVPSRATTDGDAVLDVRARPQILRHVTQTLTDLHFTSAGVSAFGHEHRWVRGDAQIDLFLPDGIGPRAAARTGITGSTTLTTPGGTEALAHAEPVRVRIAGVEADVPRPHLPGALLAKSRAYHNGQDRQRERHLIDIAVLAPLLADRDAPALAAIAANPKQKRALVSVLAQMQRQRAVWAGVDGADVGLARLHRALHR